MPWRQLQHPRPTADPSMPSFPPHALEDAYPIPPNGAVSKEYVVLKEHIGRAVLDILGLIA
jgi:hypothetical protein